MDAKCELVVWVWVLGGLLLAMCTEILVLLCVDLAGYVRRWELGLCKNVLIIYNLLLISDSEIYLFMNIYCVNLRSLLELL